MVAGTLIVSDADPVFVRVTDASAAAPTATGPTLTVAGAAVITGAMLTIVIERDARPKQPLPVAALTLKVNVPAVVGVPDSTPDAPSDRPGTGVPPASENVYGPVPPLAVSDCEYATPTVPPAGVPVMVIAEQPDSSRSSSDRGNS